MDKAGINYDAWSEPPDEEHVTDDTCKDSAAAAVVEDPFCGLTDFSMRCGNSDWDTANLQCGPLCLPGIIECDRESLYPECQADLDLTACQGTRCGKKDASDPWEDADNNCYPVCKKDGQCPEGMGCQGNVTPEKCA